MHGSHLYAQAVTTHMPAFMLQPPRLMFPSTFVHKYMSSIIHLIFISVHNVNIIVSAYMRFCYSVQAQQKPGFVFKRKPKMRTFQCYVVRST